MAPVKGVHMLDQHEDLSEEDQEVMALGRVALSDVPEEQLLAYVRRFARKRGAKPSGAAPHPPRSGDPLRPSKRRETPPRDVRDVRCCNRGDKGRTSKDCSEARVEISDRPCFICGKVGH